MKITQDKIDWAAERTLLDLGGFSTDKAVYNRNSGDILKAAIWGTQRDEPTVTVVIARNDFHNGDAYGTKVPLNILEETIKNLLAEPAVAEIYIAK
jgi:hypothetical protein